MSPVIGDVFNLLDGLKEIGIENFSAIRTVEAFNEGVLSGFAWLNVMNVDVVVLAVFHEAGTGKFRTIVNTELLRLGSVFNDLLEHRDELLSAEGQSKLYPAEFAVVIINNVQNAKARPVVKGIAHEVHAPDLIGGIRLSQRLQDPQRQPPFVRTFEMEFQGLVKAIDPLVIPGKALLAQAIMHLPKPIGRMLLGQLLKLADNGFILFPRFLAPVIISAARKVTQLAGLPDAQGVVFNEITHHGFAFGRLYHFFVSTSFKASRSRLTSAYIFFKRAFSFSSSL